MMDHYINNNANVHKLMQTILLSHTAQCNVFCTEAQHNENHKRRQHGRHEVDPGHHQRIPVAVIVDWIVGGICNNRAIAQSEGKKHLCGSLPPHLHITPDFQLKIQ